jgi:hypothetical protein
MIAIDNAVELTIKTYLGLPKRATGLTISRKQYQEISESFPDLLDALEKYAATKLTGVDLAEIEWYHRLRNQLYHQGNGLTVERKKVEIYAQLAKILFSNLFGAPLSTPSPVMGPIAQFLTAWYVLERGLATAAAPNREPGRPINSSSEAVRQLKNAGALSVNDQASFEELRALRNRVAHGEPGADKEITKDVLERVRALAKRFPFESAAG